MVTLDFRHRWTGRYEAHLWDKSSWNVTQKKKGKQVYLGEYCTWFYRPIFGSRIEVWVRENLLVCCVLNWTGAYDEEESAARAYDLAAIKYWGTSTFTNFPVWLPQLTQNLCILYFHSPFAFNSFCLIENSVLNSFLQISDYEKEIEIMQTVTKEEYLASLRRYVFNLIFNYIKTIFSSKPQNLPEFLPF